MSDRWSFNDNCSGQIYESHLPLGGGTLAAAATIAWAAKARLSSPADGKLKIDNAAGTAGIVLDGGVAATNTLTLRNAADTGLGSLAAATASLSAISLSTKLTAANTADGSAPPANQGQLYFQTNGSSKVELRVRFPTGAAIVLATEA
jgi:hypothetical protein